MNALLFFLSGFLKDPHHGLIYEPFQGLHTEEMINKMPTGREYRQRNH